MITNKYRSKKKTALQALDEIDNFIEKMDLFMEKHPEYRYKVMITKNENNDDIFKWIIELNVYKDD